MFTETDKDKPSRFRGLSLEELTNTRKVINIATRAGTGHTTLIEFYKELSEEIEERERKEHDRFVEVASTAPGVHAAFWRGERVKRRITVRVEKKVDNLAEFQDILKGLFD